MLNDKQDKEETMEKFFRERYKKQELPLFDVIISYSSLEHSGLGKEKTIILYFKILHCG